MHTHKPQDHQGHQTHAPASGVLYFITVNGKQLSFDHEIVTGLEIMTHANNDPDKEELHLKFASGEKKLILMTDKVDLSDKGIEKFRTLPKKLTDGRGANAPAPLTAEDLATLNALNKEWHTSQCSGNLLLVVKSYDLPDGYNVKQSDICIVVPQTYPHAQLDMFYFGAPLARIDGKQIHALANQDFNGRIWQRWSRHRDNSCIWKPGIDDLGSHLILLENVLRNELTR